ncbi:MAG: 3-hydroxylacyl-ACP dehydratase [Gemmatimonadaceae bacterium]
MNFPIEASLVVPHSSRMSLLDMVTGADENSLSATARVREDNPLVHDGVMGSWAVIEYMAQAIAAFEGCRARERGDKPKVGFLIGTRHMTCDVPGIAVGTELQVHIERQYEEGGLGLFDGVVTGREILANASISVYQPDNAQQFLLETRA